jgi:hypothetical protein
MFNVEYTLMEPVWGTINDIEADDRDDAEYQALQEIKVLYPEAVDVEITKVSEING